VHPLACYLSCAWSGWADEHRGAFLRGSSGAIFVAGDSHAHIWWQRILKANAQVCIHQTQFHGRLGPIQSSGTRRWYVAALLLLLPPPPSETSQSCAHCSWKDTGKSGQAPRAPSRQRVEFVAATRLGVPTSAGYPWDDSRGHLVTESRALVESTPKGERYRVVSIGTEP
jgi:hypothetical protein